MQRVPASVTKGLTRAYMSMHESRDQSLTGQALVDSLVTTCMQEWYSLTSKFTSRPDIYDIQRGKTHDKYNIFHMTPGLDVRDKAYEDISDTASTLAKKLNSAFQKDVFEPHVRREGGDLECLVAFTQSTGGIFQCKAKGNDGGASIWITMPRQEELERAFSAMVDVPHPDDGADIDGEVDNLDEPVAGDPVPDYDEGPGPQPDFDGDSFDEPGDKYSAKPMPRRESKSYSKNRFRKTTKSPNSGLTKAAIDKEKKKKKTPENIDEGLYDFFKIGFKGESKKIASKECKNKKEAQAYAKSLKADNYRQTSGPVIEGYTVIAHLKNSDKTESETFDNEGRAKAMKDRMSKNPKYSKVEIIMESFILSEAYDQVCMLVRPAIVSIYRDLPERHKEQFVDYRDAIPAIMEVLRAYSDRYEDELEALEDLSRKDTMAVFGECLGDILPIVESVAGRVRAALHRGRGQKDLDQSTAHSIAAKERGDDQTADQFRARAQRRRRGIDIANKNHDMHLQKKLNKMKSADKKFNIEMTSDAKKMDYTAKAKRSVTDLNQKATIAKKSGDNYIGKDDREAARLKKIAAEAEKKATARSSNAKKIEDALYLKHSNRVESALSKKRARLSESSDRADRFNNEIHTVITAVSSGDYQKDPEMSAKDLADDMLNLLYDRFVKNEDDTEYFNQHKGDAQERFEKAAGVNEEVAANSVASGGVDMAPDAKKKKDEETEVTNQFAAGPFRRRWSDAAKRK